MRLFADEDFSYPVVRRLRELGHDVVTVRDAGIDNDETPDDDVLKMAIQMQRIVLTHNRRHFWRLHARHPDHCGVLVATHDRNAIRLADSIHRTLAEAKELSFRGQLIRVVRPNPAE
jgi:predicted nuclease of predicted toxin-antitoxin system